MPTKQTAKIITIHSFRRGTGKTTLASGLAALGAAKGLKVGVVELGAELSSLNYAFGLGNYQFKHTLQDYLHQKVPITQATQEITPYLKAYVSGNIYLTLNRLVPASENSSDDDPIDRLGSGLFDLIDTYHLDWLILDTIAGFNDEALLAMNLSDSLCIMLRPDQQDYQGTATAVQLYGQFDKLKAFLVLNAVPALFDLDSMKQQLATSFQTSVGAVLPYVTEPFGAEGIAVFVLNHPQHTYTQQLNQLINQI
ncbi:MAG: AAA family ATPase [Chloroflexota bacterium]